jgi:hypothetical protein
MRSQHRNHAVPRYDQPAGPARLEPSVEERLESTAHALARMSPALAGSISTQQSVDPADVAAYVQCAEAIAQRYGLRVECSVIAIADFKRAPAERS